MCNHLNGNAAVRSTDDSDDWRWLIDHVRIGSVFTAEHGLVEDVERSAHVLERLVQGIRLVRAGVQNVGAQLDARQQRAVAVDVVEGEEHRLETLDAAVLLNVAAAARLVLAVHREQTAENDVAVDAGGCCVGGLRLGGWSTVQPLLLTALKLQLLATTARRRLR